MPLAGSPMRCQRTNSLTIRSAALPSCVMSRYSFVDYDRQLPLLWLGIAFVVLLLATGRLHGFRALVGLGRAY